MKLFVGEVVKDVKIVSMTVKAGFYCLGSRRTHPAKNAVCCCWNHWRTSAVIA
jgi:hypothetical protein